MRVRIAPNQTAYVGFDDRRYYGWCVEVDGAEGEGRTVKECIESIRQSIRSIEQNHPQTASPSDSRPRE